jgi:xylose dehydrogenase (NAD/NADP)
MLVIRRTRHDASAAASSRPWPEPTDLWRTAEGVVRSFGRPPYDVEAAAVQPIVVRFAGGIVTRWGILSTANINRLVLAGAAASAQVEIAAVASRDLARAVRYARDYGIPRAYGSYEELLADPSLDAIYISLPNSLHVQWSTRALQAGKHVLCEKPLSRHAEQVEELFDTAERSGRLCIEAFMWRHHPQTKRLAALVADGAIGELRLVRAAFSFPAVHPADVRLRPDLDGGALMDVGCYCVSACRLLAGEPVRVTGQQVVGPSGADVRFTGSLAFEGPALAYFDCAMDLPDRSELEAIGSKGAIRVQDPWHCRRPTLRLQRGDIVELIEVEREDSYRLELDNLSAAIRGAAEPLLGRADAIGQARVIEALYRSATTGEAASVSVPAPRRP